MDHGGPESCFLGLPLTAEQEAEIEHYLRTRLRRGLPCDVQKLKGILDDMLMPPQLEIPAENDGADSAQSDAERATVLVDDVLDPVSAQEERIAAMEAEAKKHPTG